jgi:myo-inositol-1(or 4)-monophosphatase
MPEYLEVCLEAARRAGQVLLDWRDRFQTREKGRNDLVTEADLAAQEAIRQTVLKAFPGHDFLAEEDAAERVKCGLAAICERQSDFRWIVDPLDGTMNYVHRLPGYAVSIALEIGTELEVGVVYDPLSGEQFVAQRGKGARLNGVPIQPSGCDRLCQALVAVSFSPHVHRESPEVKRFVELLIASQSVRRMGSAALNLCYVAAGRLDAYLATSVSAWDVAAGVLILREAGATIAALNGGPLQLENPELIAAASHPLLNEMVDVVARAVEK